NQVGKNGIIKDPKIHKWTIEKVINTALSTGFSVKHLTFSPIKGGAGNVEFLVHLKKEKAATVASHIDIEAVLKTEKETLT
ncbi:MAG TPA: TlyA family rRNA (cytidine-2'-O)-methyltransferase, partial [Lactococcus sp.]|nr:TlyA family rRNA (cytidine-2'-O)-methyltransferase [Lactococcus sp.]